MILARHQDSSKKKGKEGEGGFKRGESSSRDTAERLLNRLRSRKAVERRREGQLRERGISLNKRMIRGERRGGKRAEGSEGKEKTAAEPHPD